MFHICDITQRAETSPNAQNVPFFLCRPPRAIAHPIGAEDVPVHELPPLRRVGRTIRGLPLHPLLQGETGVSKSG